GLDVPPLLGGGSGSPLLTKTLLFVTQSQGMGPENSPRINVFDKVSGELLGHVPLPDSAQANPVTYMVGGRQYLVVAVGGGSFLAGIEIPPELEESEPELAAMIRAGGARSTTPQLIALALP
ncbi:MAG: hypothetical protein R3190_14285, partial [Thermoanaerobaculia bacterium]|nr:hypothetical protein [Thermoanaerobaculia bacterium]